jgi:lysophospholipase L1-like esterase
MKLPFHFPLGIVVGLLVLFLLGSVVLNYLLFNQAKWYYLQLNAGRLDPLGLNHYPVIPDQQNLTNPDLTTAVFFGDSRAANWPAPEVNQFEFINRGIGSQTSTQAALRFDDHVKPLRPQIIVVQVGINDLKTIPLFPERKEAIIANCEENIQQIVTRSTDLGTKVILTTIFPLGEVPLERRPFWSDEVALAIDEVNAYINSLDGENVTVFDAYAVLATERGIINPVYSQDLLHLNATGYERLNEEFVYFLTALE